MSPNGPTAHEIVYAIQPKSGHTYPLWQRPLFIFRRSHQSAWAVPVSRGDALEELDQETLILATDEFELKSDNDPLRVYPVSIMMKAANLPRPGVYQLYLVRASESLAKATIHAR